MSGLRTPAVAVASAPPACWRCGSRLRLAFERHAVGHDDADDCLAALAARVAALERPSRATRRARGAPPRLPRSGGSS